MKTDTAREMGMLGTALAVGAACAYAFQGDGHTVGAVIVAWVIGFNVGNSSREGTL